MNKIYKVGVILTCKIYETVEFKKNFYSKVESKKVYSGIDKEFLEWNKPIYASSQDEAIKKYKKRHDVTTCTVSIYGYGTYNTEIINRRVEVVDNNPNYTIRDLTHLMDADEFLQYINDNGVGLSLSK